jgi:hypothetical protein
MPAVLESEIMTYVLGITTHVTDGIRDTTDSPYYTRTSCKAWILKTSDRNAKEMDFLSAINFDEYIYILQYLGTRVATASNVF